MLKRKRTKCNILFINLKKIYLTIFVYFDNRAVYLFKTVNTAEAYKKKIIELKNHLSIINYIGHHEDF